MVPLSVIVRTLLRSADVASSLIVRLPPLRVKVSAGQIWRCVDVLGSADAWAGGAPGRR